MYQGPENGQHSLLRVLDSSLDAQRLFSALLESAPDAMLIVDGRGTIVLANSQTERLFGYRPGELVGQSVERLLPERLRQAHSKHRDLFLGSPRQRPMGEGLDLDGMRSDGSEFPVEISLNPIATAGGLLVSGSIRDVSERKRAEDELRSAYAELNKRVLERTAELQRLTEALIARVAVHEQTLNDLRQSEERFRLLVEGVKDHAIFMLDPEGVIVSWNAGAEHLFGFTEEEAIGSHLEDFYPRDDWQPDSPQYVLEQAVATGRFEEESWRVRKDGRRFRASTITTALRDSDGCLRGFSRITRDVTEKHALEQQLRHAQKLEAVGRLAGGVAHEFNNSATAILGYSSLILDKFSNDEQLRHYAEEIHKAGHRAAAVTRQLLAFSRQKILQPTNINLNDVVGDIEKMLRRLLGENIRVLTALDPYLGNIKADPSGMAQMIINLALNARDAMPDGGDLTIETANLELRPDLADENQQVPPGPYVRLRVSDTGTGLDKQAAAHLFEPFFTTKPVGMGTGLGLSTVYGTVKQSGGGILVFSELGKGTTFEIYLPRLAEAGVKPVLVAPVKKTSGGAETILVVEDDSSLRWLTSQILSQFGYVVLQAQDAADALSQLGQRSGNIDLVITDVIMPGSNGRQLAARIREQYPHTRLLLMSGHMAAIAQMGEKQEELPFLEKPFTPEELALIVRKVLDEGTASQLPKGA